MRYILLTFLATLLLLACCGASTDFDGVLDTALSHVSRPVDYAHEEHITETTTRSAPETKRDIEDTAREWLVMLPDVNATQPAVIEVMQYLTSLTNVAPIAVVRSDKLFLFFKSNMTDAQCDQARKHPTIASVDLNLKLEKAAVPRVRPSFSKERRDGTYKTQTLAVDELISISIPSREYNHNMFENYVYEEHAGRRSFIYHIEDGIATRRLPDEFRKVWVPILTPSAQSKGKTGEDDNNFLGDYHSTCTAGKALGSKFGVAKEATLVPVILGDFDLADLAAAFEEVAKDVEEIPERRGRSVVLLALTSEETDLTEMRLLSRAMIKVMNLDVPIVCAAGNHARSPNRKDIDTLPASLAGRYNPIIVVGSADIDGERSDFSQYNEDKISTHALGEDNTCFAESDTPTSGEDGTSYAASLVAGQIAVLLSYDEPPIDMTPGQIPENVRDYIKNNDKAGWDRALGTRMLWNGVTIADNPYFKTCNGLGPEKHWKYVTRETLNQAITNDFCNKPLDNPSQIAGYYNPGSNEDVTITATWVVPQPDPIMFKKETCVRYLLGELTDGCDAVDNPRNWKGGGVATVGGVKYTIAVQADRQDPLQDPKHGTGCDSSWKTTHDSFTVWGHGWLSADKGKALQDKLGSCHLHTNSFKFDYGLGDDGREWTSWFDTNIRQAPCVEWAAKEVGAPPGFKCNGFTH